MTFEEIEVEEIIKKYEYDNKSEKTTVSFFPDKSIATIIKTEFSGDESIEVGVVKEGMTLEEIKYFFPPTPQTAKKGYTYNLAKLVRSIIYEAFAKEGENIEEGNVRNFWYTHLKKVITERLGLGETSSVHGAINGGWDEMINSGLVTYEGMNVVGGKESSRISIVKDSPFSNLIMAVEKADYFDRYKWIPRLFNSTLITAGGQPSRTVARAFIRQLRDLGVDLDQQFYMCVASDLDPAGYYIQDAFRKQFEAAIKFYGGNGSVEIKRLFVRKDQVTQDLLEAQAMPCQDKAKKESAKKAENTKWKYFCQQTGGGLYIAVPAEWDGAVYEIDGQEVVRALLEMNAFSKAVIERSIIRELLKIIEETSDESKIMIPEIMRIFEQMRLLAAEDVYQTWHEQLIKPLIDLFLKDTKQWESEINNMYWDETHKARDHRDDQFEPIDEEYDDLVDEQKGEAREREPKLHEKYDHLESEIERLKIELQETDDEIHEKCSDIFEEIDRLEAVRDEEKQPIEEEYDAEVTNIDLREAFRKRKLKEFRDEQSSVFNPLEQVLKQDILAEMGQPDLIFYFKDIEQMTRFQPHIGRLLVEPNLLLLESISCFDQPVATFIEKELLQKASALHNENVERVRRAFPPAFTDEMKIFIKEQVQDLTFELHGDMVENVDISSDVADAISQTEKEVEEGVYQPSTDEEDEESEE